MKRKTVVASEVRLFESKIKNLEQEGWQTIVGSIVGKMNHVSSGDYGNCSDGKGFFACIMEKEEGLDQNRSATVDT